MNIGKGTRFIEILLIQSHPLSVETRLRLDPSSLCIQSSGKNCRFIVSPRFEPSSIEFFGLSSLGENWRKFDHEFRSASSLLGEVEQLGPISSISR